MYRSLGIQGKLTLHRTGKKKICDDGAQPETGEPSEDWHESDDAANDDNCQVEYDQEHIKNHLADKEPREFLLLYTANILQYFIPDASSNDKAD